MNHLRYRICSASRRTEAGRDGRKLNGAGYNCPMQPLKHLVFNFLPINPAESGGIATVCQTMARHIPTAAGAAKTWVLTGTEDWEAHFPLEGVFERVVYPKEAQRRAGLDLERRMAPLAPWQALRHVLARLGGWRSAFYPALARSSLVHCPYQILCIAWTLKPPS